MFDFPMKESSIWTSLYCFIFFLIILRSNYRNGLKEPFSRRINIAIRERAYILICFFFITHCLLGDFFHFMENVQEYIFIPGYYNYGEEIYQAIAKFVNKNYFLFRTIVWGGAFGLFCWTAKRLEVPIYYAVIFLFATHSIIFAYARATAAMAVYFFGLSFLIKPVTKSKWLGYVVGGFLIYSSCFFHNSALIMVIMTGIILVPLRKWNIIVIVLMIPFLSIFLKEYLFLFAQETTNETLAAKINNYSEREIENGISAIIIKLFEYLSFYLPFIISSLCIFKKREELVIPSYIYNLYKVTFGLILVCTTFYFLGESFITFFYRILFMTMIPLSLIVVKLYQQGLMTLKQYHYCVIPGFIFLLLRYLYDVYLNYLNL